MYHARVQCCCSTRACPHNLIVYIMGTLMEQNLELESIRWRPVETSRKQNVIKLGIVVFKPNKGEKFLKGPIQWSWLQAAARAPGKALHVGNVLWFFAGMSGPRVALNLSRLADLGLSRDAARRGLAALERAKLVSVLRHPGRKPVVTILIQEFAPQSVSKSAEES